MRVTITEKSSGAVLADARDAQVHKAEGNWYLDPSSVDATKLEVTTHDYTCPYKGTCHYVDYVDGATRVPRVAWVYANPKDGWDAIKGRYGFYSGAMPASKTDDRVEE